MIKKISFAIATLFGAGFFPVSAGTFGSFASFVFIVPIAYFYGFSGLLIFSVISFILGLLAVRKVLHYTEHDPSFIVIDETIGQTVTFFLVSNLLKGSFSGWYFYILGFAFFRFFDITKPSIIGWVDRKIENAFGVICDDILAGITSSLCLYLIQLIF